MCWLKFLRFKKELQIRLEGHLNPNDVRPLCELQCILKSAK